MPQCVEVLRPPRLPRAHVEVGQGGLVLRGDRQRDQAVVGQRLVGERVALVARLGEVLAG